jgi:hypothetical protein
MAIGHVVRYAALTAATITALTLAAASPAYADAPPTGPFGGGLYQVGVDIAPGTYKTTGPNEDDIVKLCIWQRKANDSGDFSAIKASGMTEGRNSVTIRNGEWVELTGCTWTHQ